MTSLDSGTARPRSSNLRRALFVLLAAMTLWALYVYDLPILGDAKNTARLMGFGWLLLPHGLAGVAAFIIGPLQFSDRLRARNLQLHRRLGQTYVAAVTIAGLLALVIALRFEEFGITELVAQALAWMLCTYCAWFATRNRSIAQHKLWMARSYGLTFVFVTNRLVLGQFLPGASNWAINDASWAVLLAALIIPDILMSGGALRPWRRA